MKCREKRKVVEEDQQKKALVQGEGLGWCSSSPRCMIECLSSGLGLATNLFEDFCEPTRYICCCLYCGWVPSTFFYDFSFLATGFSQLSANAPQRHYGDLTIPCTKIVKLWKQRSVPAWSAGCLIDPQDWFKCSILWICKIIVQNCQEAELKAAEYIMQEIFKLCGQCAHNWPKNHK